MGAATLLLEGRGNSNELQELQDSARDEVQELELLELELGLREL